MSHEIQATAHPRPGFVYLAPVDYCRRAGISRPTFWRNVKSGRIEIVRFTPRTPRVPVAESAHEHESAGTAKAAA